jgi:lysophospholipase L1-like esterase
VSTKIVILDMGGGYYNNRKLTAASQARGHADMEEIQANLKSRGIEIIHWLSREPINLRQADKIHLTAEGHRAAAQELEPKVIQALKSLGG